MKITDKSSAIFGLTCSKNQTYSVELYLTRFKASLSGWTRLKTSRSRTFFFF